MFELHGKIYSLKLKKSTIATELVFACFWLDLGSMSNESVK